MSAAFRTRYQNC